MRISVFDVTELAATIAAAKASEAEIRKQMRRQTKEHALPIWWRAVAERVTSLTDARVLQDTARVSVSDQNVTLQSARIKGKKFSGGANAQILYASTEFGALGRWSDYETRSRAGRRYRVRRRTTEQLPDRAPKGRVVYQAAAEVIPRIAALWTQTVLRTFMETLERK